MPVDKTQIEEELKSKKSLAPLFLEENAAYLHDTVEIAHLIANGEDPIKTALAKLEKELLKEVSVGLSDDLAAMVLSESMTFKAAQVAQTEADIDNALRYFNKWQDRISEKVMLASTTRDNKSPIPKPTKTRNIASKALNKVLAKTETAMGFTLLDHQETKVYFGVLDKDSFQADTDLGVPFKDIINPEHGEFTHRIQWYIAMHCAIPLMTPAPQMVDLYRFITGLSFLWVYVFDRSKMGEKFAPADTILDFRRPEYFHPWLCNEARAAHYPLLHGFLKARHQKREATADPFAWLASRIFGRKITSMDQLSLEDLMTVRDYSNSARGIYKRDIVPQALKNPLLN